MSFLLLLPLAFVGGMAAQFAVNSQLRNVVGGPISAAAVSFIVGAVVLSVAAVVGVDGRASRRALRPRLHNPHPAPRSP